MKSKFERTRSVLAGFMVFMMVASLVPVANAAQVNSYHDPADHWMTALDRTNELDANAVVSHETFYCVQCERNTSFQLWRTPEYTRDGVTAMSRNVRYSDGTCSDGVSKGVILDGAPGVDAFYTGYHWTKANCTMCGTMNSNNTIKTGYGYDNNVYGLYDCAAEFTEDLPESVTYEYADVNYHKKTTATGDYCVFCYGTHKQEEVAMERHTMEQEILAQPAHGRFAIVDHCTLCEYNSYEYVGAKAVIADYYGVVDGQPHTITVTDLTEAGVTTQIRYGTDANACTMTSAPNFTEEGQYTVYYEITYTYKNVSMTENGVAYVWLRDETVAEDGTCTCGCGDPDCGCQDKHCTGDCCNDDVCGENHNFILMDSTEATCLALGYDRYLCVECGKIEKRDYVESLGHAWQGVLIREATCETDGKLLELCSRCGLTKVTNTPKGEHDYDTHTVGATCTTPGYSVKECTVCGDRHIYDILGAKPHNYEPKLTPAGCTTGGHTTHICFGCGSSFTTDYTDPLGHTWDDGTLVTNATCNGEGVMEYRCERCGYHRLDGVDANGHVPGDSATCTEPQTCTKCGAVIQNALGHDYETEVTAPTCTEMGFTIYTCACGDTHKGDYTDPTGHKPGDWIIDKEPTTDSDGSKHTECENCGETLDTEEIEQLYNQDTTDGKGEAIVGGYLVTVTDTDSKNPVSNARVTLHDDDTISIRLPNGRLLDYDNQTTVKVQLVKDKSPVEDMFLAITDRNGNDCEGETDAAGQLTVPGTPGKTNEDGTATGGYEDKDGDRWTLTIRVEDYETGRPIEDATVTIGKTGTITVTLPDGEDMDEDNRITVIVTDHEKDPQEGQNVTVKGDLGQKASGQTDEDGKLTVPEVLETEHHAVYIIGYPDGTFGPTKLMTRAEATAIFARLLAEELDEDIPDSGRTKFKDVPSDAWYAGYVKYLTGYGVVYGRESNKFYPDEPITRAEFTAFAVRFFDAYGDGNPEIMDKYAEFDDVDNGYWAAEYIKDAALYGWVEGYGDGTFRAEDEINRAEVVTIVNRLLDREADEDYIAKNLRKLNTFTDMSKRHWAYFDVMEAANAHNATMDPDESWHK